MPRKSRPTRSASSSPAPAPSDPVTAYAEQVVAGEVVAGRLIRLACERHLRDLAEGAARGLRFDPATAQRALDFFPEILRLAEGEHADQPFRLSPFQQFIVGSLFGWFGEDGFRRYRTAYIEIGKGSGKSPLAAGIGLYGLVADGERAAQVYSAATTREQAKIVWGDASKMVAASPALSERIEETVNNLAFLEMGSFFRPVSADASRLDGFRPHIVIADEVHEHPSGKVIDKMRAGFKGRRQPLLVEITNSGFDRKSICWQHHEYSCRVLEGVAANDSWFAFVCGLDPCAKCWKQGYRQPRDGCKRCDDWRDEAVWPKANPNLGVSLTWKYLREQVQEAIELPSKQNLVKRLNFCIWTEQSVRWLDLDAWDRGAEAVPEEELIGQPCVAGLDLSSTTDLTALVLVFPRPDGRKVVRCRFWCPEEGVRKRAERDKVPYQEWVQAGLLTATPGNVVDYDRIRLDIQDDAERYNLREVAIDRWNSTQLVSQLQGDGLTVALFGQGFQSMSAPSKALEAEVLAGRLRHGAHPLLRWMAGNVAVEQDAAGNIKPSKAKSTERIDGMVALVMALGRLMVNPDLTSVYEDRGILFV